VTVAQKTTVPDWLEAVGTGARGANEPSFESDEGQYPLEIRSHEGDRGRTDRCWRQSTTRNRAPQPTRPKLLWLSQKTKYLPPIRTWYSPKQLCCATSSFMTRNRSVRQEFDEIKARYQSAEARRDMKRAGKAQASAAFDSSPRPR